MEEEQETKFCSNCKKDIPANNFMMHVPHCQRNIILCDQCQEPVPKSQQDEHFEEYHVEVKCECGESMEKSHLEEHKEKVCKSRKTNCLYCELECTVGEIDSHKEYCGSRTELCERCNRRIQHRDLEEHLQSDCTLNDNEPTPNNIHVTNGSRSLQNGFSRTLPEQMVQNFGFGDFDDVALAGGPEVFRQLIASGFMTLPVRDVYNQDQFFDDGRNIYSSVRASRDNIIARGSSNNRRQREPRRERNHHVVDNQVRNDDGVAWRQNLEDDELMATLLACDDDGDTYAGFKEPLPGIKHLQDDHNSHSDDDQGTDLDETILPCEFCGEPVTAQDLIQHQTGCQLTSMGSPSLYPQLRSQPRSLPPLAPESYSDDDQERNGNIEHNDETFLPCEFCQELFPYDSLIGHQSICDPVESRPSSAVHTFQGAYFESDQQGLNNSTPRTRTRPPRPSRPVVASDSSSEQDGNLFHPTSDLRSSRRVTSNDEGSTFLFNPVGELHSFRGTYANDDDNSSSNNSRSNNNTGNSSSNNGRSSNNDRSSNDGRSSQSRSSHGRSSHGRSSQDRSNSNDIGNNSSSRHLASGNSRSHRNNEVRLRPRGSLSNSVPLTVRNGQASQGAIDSQGRRKTTSNHLSRPARVTNDDKEEERVVALPKRSSTKITSASSYDDRYRGLMESGKNSLNNDNDVSAFSVNGRHWNGTTSEEAGDDPPWEMRPLQETGATYSASANQRPPRKGKSSSGHAFQHSTETRKQMARLAPSFDKPSRSTDSRKEGPKNQTRTTKKATTSERNELRTSERGAQGTSGRSNSSTKPRSRKKIV